MFRKEEREGRTSHHYRKVWQIHDRPSAEEQKIGIVVRREMAGRKEAPRNLRKKER